MHKIFASEGSVWGLRNWLSAVAFRMLCRDEHEHIDDTRSSFQRSLVRLVQHLFKALGSARPCLQIFVSIAHIGSALYLAGDAMIPIVTGVQRWLTSFISETYGILVFEVIRLLRIQSYVLRGHHGMRYKLNLMAAVSLLTFLRSSDAG